MSIAKHHVEWLSLVEVSGPFLSLPVLVQKFPQGLDNHDPEHFRLLRQVHEEWDNEQRGQQPDRAIHSQWIKWVLTNTLDLGDTLSEGQEIPQTLKSDLPEHGEKLRPDMVLMDPASKKARMLIQTYPFKQGLTRVVEGKPWKAAPDTRMMQLLHDTDVRLGLVTNGDQWMLVDAPKGETTGYASWYSTLWLEEAKTLQAFRTLLSSYRFFGVPDSETLEALLAHSAEDQQEVTDQLGYQVRRAVEVLVQSLDKADREYSGKLLTNVDDERLYEAALTVMMRLVFLFCAEERELLLLGDEMYDRNYAVSTLREQLRKTADEFGEEILERRHDAWVRLLTTFRAVYGGVQHDRLKLPAYGGNLFDPDRFPFLEGRHQNTSWKDTPSQPVPINNRTVLHLLEALQVLQVKLPGGGPAEPRKLSFRALDIEQIGHVYEGLLDHTAVRATEPVLGLSGTRDKEPEIPLSKLEELTAKGEKELHKFLKAETGRSSVSPIKRMLTTEIDDQSNSRFRTACQGDEQLWEQIKPFSGLVRTDTFGYPIVIPAGSVFVTAGTDRRSSGTHYTPRSLTEPIVRYTLEPLVYEGPAEGKPKSEWRLRSAAELLNLKICDMACGSGAFLVQACRYMSERLAEAWEAAEKQFESSPRITPTGDLSEGGPEEHLIPIDNQERLVYARRIIASHCLYGVDKNPLACEMAKLSLWLLTLAKDKPFTFVDHAIRCGDSLVGISSTDQLTQFSPKGRAQQVSFSQEQIRKRLDAANLIRREIEYLDDSTVENVDRKFTLLEQANEQSGRLIHAADLLLAASWQTMSEDERERVLEATLMDVELRLKDFPIHELYQQIKQHLQSIGCRHPFHWPLEFPEVFEQGGFNAIIGNPPFMGGKKIKGNLGQGYRNYLVDHLANGVKGHADLCTYFVLRGVTLLVGNGRLGFVTTNTIAQGDTREVGLKPLLETGCTIPRAISSRNWPGTATVFYACIWLRKGGWEGQFVLDDLIVSGITSFLTTPDTISGDPFKLADNLEKSFTGSFVLGMGFVLTPEEASRLIEKDPCNKDVLFPYIVGEDLNSSPEQLPSRWVIRFFDWPLSRETAPNGYVGPVAADYPDCLTIVEQKVKPERTRRKDNGDFALRKPLPQKWWIYADKRPALYSIIAGKQRVLVLSLITNHVSFAFAPPEWVFAHKLAVFPYEDYAHFAVMQSTLHYCWAWRYSSTNLALLNYSPSDCFRTFPFPIGFTNHSKRYLALNSHGERYYELRRNIMVNRHEGLTKTYNRFHDPDETCKEIKELREMHVKMDYAVAEAYELCQIELDHGFYKLRQGLRYTISEVARREVLGHLLKINHERYTEEVEQGLHDKKGKGKIRRKAARKTTDIQSTLF